MAKDWYRSKTIQAGIALVIIGILDFVGVPPQIVDILYPLAGAYGLVGLRTAKEAIQ